MDSRPYFTQTNTVLSYGVGDIVNLNSTHCLLPLCSKLVMLQTTNGIFNKEIYHNVTKHGLLAWHRVRIANWLASGGKAWCEIVSSYNTGEPPPPLHYKAPGRIRGWSPGECCVLCPLYVGQFCGTQS